MECGCVVETIERTLVMITMTPGQEPALTAALAAMGMELPRMGRFTEAGGLLLARTAPDHLLVMRPGDDAGLMDELAPLTAVAGLIDQSDARVAVSIEAADAVDRLSRLLPIDLHPDHFGPGRCTQTAMGHLTVLVIRRDHDAFEVLCGRSFAASFGRAVDAAMDTVAA
jgi:heterotetrameric sarcosine oxidase gamma subunit